MFFRFKVALLHKDPYKYPTDLKASGGRLRIAYISSGVSLSTTYQCEAKGKLAMSLAICEICERVFLIL